MNWSLAKRLLYPAALFSVHIDREILFQIMNHTESPPKECAPTAHPTFREALRFWIKLGFISFGGPAGQIAIMHRELVEKRRWISETRFLHALNYCMLLPGPEAQQLATYIGWLLHKTRGGLAAGIFFVLPSMFILWLLSLVYVNYGTLPWVAAIFYGLKPAVLAIVASAGIRIGKKALRNELLWGIALIAFLSIRFLQVPFPVIVFGAGLIGLVGGFFWMEKFVPPRASADKGNLTVLDDSDLAPSHTRPSFWRGVRVFFICISLWWAPVLACSVWLGSDHTLVKEGFFFSKAAMVTFGGAYAVLPYVSEEAVKNFQWLTAHQMLDGLGLAETTPGPLIMVLQFVGFMGAFYHPGPLSPLLSATLGAFMTTWCTFVPCFLWIFLGAPYIEQLRGNLRLTTALAAVTAAVVGVILNLGVWFGVQLYFPPNLPVDLFAILLSLVVFMGLQKFKWDVIPVVLGAGLAGFVFRFLTGDL